MINAFKDVLKKPDKRTASTLVREISHLKKELQRAKANNFKLEQLIALHSENDKLHNDLKRAAFLQKGILPQEKSLDCLEINWFYQSSDLLGGDTFDYAQIGKGLYFFCSVDVSGHGISAALLSMYIHNYFRNEIRIFRNSIASKYDTNLSNRLLHTIVLINEQMIDALSFVDDYFTAFVGIINTNTDQLELIQAGHPKPYLVDLRKDQKGYKNEIKAHQINVSGMPIGLSEDGHYAVEKCDFPKGSRLVITSDGIFDVKFDSSNNLSQELFSEQDLQRFLTDTTNLTSKKVIPALDDYLQLSNNTHADDISFLVIDYK